MYKPDKSPGAKISDDIRSFDLERRILTDGFPTQIKHDDVIKWKHFPHY